MDSLVDLCEAFEGVSLEECQQVLDNPQDSSSSVLTTPDKGLLESALKTLLELNTLQGGTATATARDVNVNTIACLKKLCAHSILGMTMSSDQEVKFMAARLIIVLSSLPSASAFGVYNSNIMQAVLGTVNKLVGTELKSLQSSDKPASKEDTVSMNIQLDEENKSSRRSKRGKSTAEGSSESDQDSEDEAEAQDGDENMFGPRASRSQVTAAALARIKLKPQLLHAFMQDALQCVALFACQSDDFVLSSAADLLVSVLYLCATKPEYSGTSRLCEAAVKGFAVNNRTSLIAAYRSLMPILTLTTRNPLLPDNAKIKRACHKAALSAVVEIITSSCQSPLLLVVENQEEASETSSNPEDSSSVTAPHSPESPDDRRSSINSAASSASFQSAVGTKVSLPLAYTCLIGALQRITLSPPDRAPVRQVLLGSLMDMMTALGNIVSLALPANVQCAATHAVKHYLGFLSKLSRSMRVAHRAFSLDVTAQLLSTSWLWELPCAENDITENDCSNSYSTPCSILLEVLRERCLDCSPAVRTRALTALQDLIVNLNESSTRSMVQALFDAAMGSKPLHLATNAPDQEGKLSLIDLFRERCADEKPGVRAKALQALGVSLSMTWPKIGFEGNREFMTMLVTEDDLVVFSQLCHDSSLSVRKQAMHSLTELLISRPADTLIQDVWVQSVVPMAFDAEATVASKVAESIHTLLFDNLMCWYVDQQAEGSSHGSRVQQTHERSEFTSLVWKLSAKIIAMGMFKILKAAMSTMLKQGYLIAASPVKSDTRSSSVLAVIAALKFACCCHLDRTDAASAVQNMRGCEPEEIARGAWIMLESLVSLEGMTILNAKQEPVKFRDFIRQAGSADFVVRCYKQKHQSDATVLWDEEDLRIFKVLEILGSNLSKDDAAYMKSQVMENLEQMQCQCHIAAAAIALMLQLSKTETLLGMDPTSPEAAKALKCSVESWAGILQNSVLEILHIFALRTRSVVVKGDTIPATTSVGQLMIDWLQENCSHDAALLIDSSTMTVPTAVITLNAHVLEAVQTALFVLGEVSMLGFSMEEDHFLGTDSKKANTSPKSAELFRLTINPAVVDLVKILMGHFLPLADGATGSQRTCPNKIRANAFVTMGKLCMRNKVLARENVNIFLREVSLKNAPEESLNMSSLSTLTHSQINASAAVRSNALLVLGDMCIRYTNLVDRHVDTMAQCLQDSDTIVRKNALILLTQLLLQDFLKWKGFLLYRLLVLTVDSDAEIAEFSRNILQKTLSLKYPQLLTNHFTETLVILNDCTAHPAYSSIARTGVMADSTIDSILGEGSALSSASQMETDGDGNDLTPAEVIFTANLSKVQRFGVYAFMAENMDDETKIQVSAKLVQDVLTAAVDSTTLLPQANQAVSRKQDREKYAPFESVLEDTLALLRSPHLKVGHKRVGNEDGDEIEEDVAAEASNPKTAFVRAKCKVLQKLSTQHLVSHTLPVAISLKHILETTKSPLQGALMEFLVALVKHHKNEVEEALQFDPTLRSEIEYDLKEFERTKKEKLTAAIQASQAFSTRKSPPGTAGLPGTALKSKSPYLDLQQVPAHSIVKPALRKSLGGQSSRGRTPFDALKSPGMNLSKSVIKSALSSAKIGSGSAQVDDEVDRLTFSQMDAPGSSHKQSGVKTSASKTRDEAMSEDFGIDCATQKLFQDDSVALAGEDALLPSAHKQSKRRSWGVVVNSLPTADSSLFGTNSTRSSLSSNGSESPNKDRSSPPKKKRCRKSNSPKVISDSLNKNVSFGNDEEGVSENKPDAANNSNFMPPPPAVKGGRAASRVALSQENTLLSTISRKQQDDAVNAFDRLLAGTAAAKDVTAASTAGAGAKIPRGTQQNQGVSRGAKRAVAQRGDSLMGFL